MALNHSKSSNFEHLVLKGLMVNFEVKWKLHDFNTCCLFNKAKQTFSFEVYAILLSKKSAILELNPDSCRTRTEPNPNNKGSFSSLVSLLGSCHT